MSERVLGGRYRVETRIGAGGMAEVFRGFDTRLDRTVAIKVLLPQYARDASFVERFRREAQAAARLNHPNIVGVFDSGADDDTQWIVMEYIEGRTLGEFLSSGRRPTPVQACEITEHVCSALAAAHAQGVVHRDIKPGNIMVTRDGAVKVMDFGIARITTGDATAPQTSAVLGTATYLSPEQAQGGPLDSRTDIYSLGAVLYELIAGRPPFTGESPVAIAYKQVNESPVPPSQVNADVPPRLDAVVMRALSKNPANRYQTADEFKADLERVRNGQEVEATPLLAGAAVAGATQVISRPPSTEVMPPVTEPEGGGRKIWLGILIGVVVVALLAGGGYLLVNSLAGGDEVKNREIPDLVGERVQDAIDRLDQLGLDNEVQRRATDRENPGIVLETDPPEGTRVEEGTVVTLIVAKALPTVEVPDLTGLTLSEAQSQLQQAELDLGSRTEQASSDVDEGRIISQSPLSGSEVAKGSLVDVVISTGPEIATVFDLRCLTLETATKKLEKVGLQLTNGGTVSDTPCTHADRVAAQDPAPGTQLEVGSTVVVFFGEKTPSPSAAPQHGPGNGQGNGNGNGNGGPGPD